MFKEADQNKRVIQGGLAKRQICFLSCAKKSRDDISGNSPARGRDFILGFLPPALVCGFLPQLARWLLALRPPGPHSRLTGKKSKGKCSVPEGRAPSLKSFPRSPTQRLTQTSHWTPVHHMSTSICKEDWEIELLNWDHSKIKSELMSQ